VAQARSGYFDQFRQPVDDDATLIDTIAPGSDFVESAGSASTSSATWKISCSPLSVRAPRSARCRAASATGCCWRLFARPANLLVLDEPTNDLDIEPGTAGTVAAGLQRHGADRFTRPYFSRQRRHPVDRVRGDGKLTESSVAMATGWPGSASKPGSGGQGRDAEAVAAKPAAKSKLNYKDARELEALPAHIPAAGNRAKWTLRDDWPTLRCIRPIRKMRRNCGPQRGDRHRVARRAGALGSTGGEAGWLRFVDHVDVSRETEPVAGKMADEFLIPLM